MKCYLIYLFLFFAFFLIVPQAFANLGVGVGTGKIVVNEQLKPGMIYQLPSFSVINTGDIASDYSVGVAYHEGQGELQPAKEWFSFSPKEFYLEPGESQLIEVKLNLPIKVNPGKYFAYLEGFPTKNVQQGDTSVGISAAVKLYFDIKPENLALGVYYFTTSLLNIYQPWTTIGLGILALFIVILVFRRHFNFNIKINRKDSNPPDSTQKN